LRGSAGMVALTIFFLTLHKLPLAIASTLQYLSPIFTVLIAQQLFKEKVTPMQIMSSFLAFVGVLLIGTPSLLETNSVIDPFWIIMGIISAIFSGIAYNAIGKLKNTEEPINIVIYFPMIALPITGVWCLFDFTFPVGIEWLLLLIIGIFTQIAQILMTKAFLATDTAIVAPFQYIGAIYALLSGWFIFDESLGLIPVTGITLVLIGVLIGTIFRKKQLGSTKIS
jgi:drug/metabolite transporter (DMT)-like permease